MAGFQRERLMGQCGLVLVSRALNARLFLRQKHSSIFNLVSFSFTSIFLYLESVLLLHGAIAYHLYLSMSYIVSHICFFVFFVFLQETDWSNVHSKLLISSTDVQRSNVHDGQSRCLLSFVLNHSLTPLACVFL